MKKVVIIGANGQIAKLVEKHYLNQEGIQFNLLARNSKRLPKEIQQAENVKIFEGDANSYEDVLASVRGTDLVYLNLGGLFTPMVKNIIQVMEDCGVKRLIHVTGLGLYHEVPEPFGTWLEESVGHATMEDTRNAAQLIETNPKLDYTIIRAAYMSNEEEVNYEITTRHEAFRGTTISRVSIANLIEKIIDNPALYQNESLGISTPGTDGPHPIY